MLARAVDGVVWLLGAGADGRWIRPTPLCAAFAVLVADDLEDMAGCAAGRLIDLAPLGLPGVLLSAVEVLRLVADLRTAVARVEEWAGSLRVEFAGDDRTVLALIAH